LTVIRSPAADVIPGLPAAFCCLLYPREEYENETTVSDPLRMAPRKLPEMADRLHPEAKR
ncbi:hypothetical protein, partial [Escherichia coli]|uniref:hypothetical protein n=1 Tax=Escherichia coli TaxID=562 RepID=UPI001BC89D3F